MDLGGGQISSTPSAVMAGNQLTIFARALEGTITHKFYDPGNSNGPAGSPSETDRSHPNHQP
jgi:hypothetical protein